MPVMPSGCLNSATRGAVCGCLPPTGVAALAILLIGMTADIAEAQTGKGHRGDKRLLFVVQTDGQYSDRKVTTAVDNELKELPKRLKFVGEAPNLSDSDYSFRNARLGDFLDGRLLELGADYSQQKGASPSEPRKGVCCDCRADPERAARLVVADLLSNTLLHPERGPYKPIRVDDCRVEGNKLELTLDLQGSVGFEQKVIYTVGSEKLDITLYPHDVLEESGSTVKAEFLLFGQGTCREIENKDLRMHLDKPEPCLGGQLPNKGRE